MKQLLIVCITAALLLCGCGGKNETAVTASSAASGDTAVTASSAASGHTAVTASSAASGDTAVTASSDASGEDLRVIFAEARQLVKPGEAGTTLKSTQVAADLLDFTLGTDLPAEEIEEQSRAYFETLSGQAADIFVEQMACVSGAVDMLKDDGAEDLLQDAGVSDSSYPWTDDAFARADAIFLGCGIS